MLLLWCTYTVDDFLLAGKNDEIVNQMEGDFDKLMNELNIFIPFNNSDSKLLEYTSKYFNPIA